jgi:hypothetical protein
VIKESDATTDRKGRRLQVSCKIQNGAEHAEKHMKTFLKSAIVLLMLHSTFAMAEDQAKATLENIVAGVFTTASNTNWAGLSSVNLIAGTSVMPATSTQTVLYIAFTGGTNADLGNMVLYTTTARSAYTVNAVTKVTYKGATNPSFNLTNTSICPTQPVSATNPCIIKLDPINLVLSTVVDYYFVAYFVNDSNNETLAAASPALSHITTLTGFVDNKDDTGIAVGGTLPTTNSGKPTVLVSVMTE